MKAYSLTLGSIEGSGWFAPAGSGAAGAQRAIRRHSQWTGVETIPNQHRFPSASGTSSDVTGILSAEVALQNANGQAGRPVRSDDLGSRPRGIDHR